MRPTRRRTRLFLAGLAAAAAGSSLVTAVPAAPAAPAARTSAPAAEPSANRPVPRSFTGYAFDQCLAPTQSAMDAWLYESPYWAVGIYISGKSRACRSQPNLTPTWISTQIAKGWRLLPITLGPQASCSTRFPRYGNDPVISPDPASGFAKARAMGRAEANDATSVATRLGIVPGSTLWYDLEAFDTSRTRCRESALRFVGAWTKRLHELGYVSGFYSSAASGIRMLDDVRVNRPSLITLPDRIWVADWNGRADVESSYIRSDGWKPGNRMHQYRGGHDETWGGVRINVDTNFLDLGTGSVPPPAKTYCGGVTMNYSRYTTLRSGMTHEQVRTLQCLLRRQKLYTGPMTGTMDAATVSSVRSMRQARGLSGGATVGARAWATLLAAGGGGLKKYGANGEAVRQLQRTLNALYPASVPVTGVFEARTTAAVKRYQADLGLSRSGVVVPTVWTALRAGRRP